MDLKRNGGRKSTGNEPLSYHIVRRKNRKKERMLPGRN